MNAIETRVNYGLTYAVASYGMTFLRLGIALFIGVSLLLNSTNVKLIAVVGTSFIILFDYYDGVLFNKSYLVGIKQWRVNRRILDATIDRAVIQAVCLSLLIIDSRFLVFYLAILFREIVLSAFSTRQFYKGFLIYPGPLAKIACVSVGFTGISYLITNSVITGFVTATMLVVSAFALREYRVSLIQFRNGELKEELGKGVEVI